MPQNGKKAPVSWYIIDILIGIGAALYMRYLGADAGRDSMQEYGVVGLVAAVILAIGSVVTKVRGMVPFAVGTLAFGALALYLAR